MKVFSLFTGIGGLEWGLKDMAEFVGYSEIKKSSIDIYEKYNDVKNYGDVTKIDFTKLPDFDLLLGGFPCQSFSLAGLRKGFEDERGKMIFYIHDLLKKKQPNFFVLENVKGIINHNKGSTFVDVVKLLQNAGYYIRVVLLNSLNYGSAQSRERVFFLGSKKDFDIKIPRVINSNVRFRNVRDENGNYRFITDNERNKEKINQLRNFSFELIGGYDRVGTLTTQVGCGEKVVYEKEEDQFRYLTPLECERLQGFPDGYTEGISDNARYWALGNAVSCDVSNYLFKEYLKGLWW